MSKLREASWTELDLVAQSKVHLAKTGSRLCKCSEVLPLNVCTLTQVLCSTKSVYRVKVRTATNAGTKLYSSKDKGYNYTFYLHRDGGSGRVLNSVS